MIATLLFLLAFVAQATSATYDTYCMDLVTRDPHQSEAYQLARSEWEQPIREVWGIQRDLSSVDFEALMDLTHGLDISVIFKNGVRATEVLRSGSFTAFQNLIQQHQVFEVEYTAESNRQLSKILVAACLLLSKPNCFVYEDYLGFHMGSNHRPFTLAQEQALKWATIHIAPVKNMELAYGIIPAPYNQIERFNTRVMDQKQLLSLYILMSAFGEKDGSLLHVGLAQQFIEEAFERTIRRHRSVAF